MSDHKIIDDGGPAFPCGPFGQTMHGEDGREWHQCDRLPGMTLRDWFASQERIDQSEEFGWPLLEALAGPRPKGDWNSNPLEWFDWSNKWQAAVRYYRADAMIEMRKHE